MDYRLPYFIARPKYWAGLLAFTLAWVVARLPLAAQRSLSRLLGWLMLHLSAKHKKIVDINLRLCFPQKTEEERQQIIRENAIMTGFGVIETCATWFSNLSSRLKVTEVVGRKYLDEALEKDKGVILLGFHMTSLEVGANLLANHYPLVGMYKPDRNPLIEFMMCQGRLRHIHGLVKQNDVRSMVKALKSNQIIWYAADQDYGRNKAAVFAPFFGIPASTITATTKFARLSGATVLPFTQKRINGGKSYHLEIHPPLENFPGENEVADATQINAFLESYLRDNPADYIWVHQRFRTRPEGESPIYPKKN